jgi:hypothetical protein
MGGTLTVLEPVNELSVGHDPRAGRDQFLQSSKDTVAVAIHEPVQQKVIIEARVHDPFLFGIDVVRMKVTNQRLPYFDLSTKAMLN